MGWAHRLEEFQYSWQGIHVPRSA